MRNPCFDSFDLFTYCCDAARQVHLLLKSIIGLAGDGYGHVPEDCVGLRRAITGDQSVVPSALGLIIGGHEAAPKAGASLPQSL